MNKLERFGIEKDVEEFYHFQNYEKDRYIYIFKNGYIVDVIVMPNGKCTCEMEFLREKKVKNEEVAVKFLEKIAKKEPKEKQNEIQSNA